MLNNKEFFGKWFLPEFPEKLVVGKLTVQDGRSNLIIYGSFYEGFVEIEDVKYICGISNDGKEFTLYDCLFLSSKRNINNYEMTEYLINYTLEGIQINKEITFHKISCKISHLDEWFGIHGFKKENTDWKNFSIQYLQPENINISIDEDITAQFSFQFTQSSKFNFVKEVILTQEVIFTIFSKNGKLLNDMLLYLTRFSSFLSLAVYDATNIKNITICSNEYFYERNNENIDYKIIYLNPPITQVPVLKVKSKREMIFNYDDIKPNFENIVSSWFFKYDLLALPIDLFFNQLRLKGSLRMIENEFLNLAQALETFHSIKNKGRTRIPDEEYEVILAELISLAPKYKKIIKEKFKYSNSLYLSQRLSELMEDYTTQTLKNALGDINKLIFQITNTRNYYTHYNPDLESKALKGVDLIFLIEKVKILLASAILIEIGFDIEMLERLFKEKKHKFFDHLNE